MDYVEKYKCNKEDIWNAALEDIMDESHHAFTQFLLFIPNLLDILNGFLHDFVFSLNPLPE